MPTATTLPSGSAKYAASSPQPRSDSWRFRQPSSGLWETDDKPFAFHLELSSHCVEHSRADSGAEVLEVVAKRNGAHAVCHGPDRHGRAVDGERDLLERAVAADALGERRECLLRPRRIDLHRRSAALGDRMAVQTRHGRVDELARVGLARLDVEAAGL